MTTTTDDITDIARGVPSEKAVATEPPKMNKKVKDALIEEIKADLRTPKLAIFDNHKEGYRHLRYAILILGKSPTLVDHWVGYNSDCGVKEYEEALLEFIWE